MVLRKVLSALAAASLVASPLAAQAADRKATAVEGENIAGSAWYIPLAVLIIVIGGVLLLADDNNPEQPHSP